MFIQDHLFESELLWMLLGEKMSQGFTVYGDIDDLTSVFSAGMYWLLDLGFGRSTVAHQIIALIFVSIQLFFFNTFSNQMTLLNERNYVLAFIYFVLACSAPDFFLLSPDLMATTFMLFAVYFLFQEMKESNTDDNLLAMGWSFGLALVFNVHFIYFALMIVLSLILYTTLNARKLVLMLLGACIPYGLIGIYYVFNDEFNYFFYEGILFPLFTKSSNYVSYLELLAIFGVTLFIGVIAVLKVYASQGYVNFKVRCQTVFVLWIISGILCALMSEKHSWYTYYSLIVPFSYFISAFFIAIKKRFVRMIFVYSFLASCFYGGFHYAFKSDNTLVDYTRMEVMPSDTTSYSSLLVVGDRYDKYLYSPLGSRFLNWKIAKQYFEGMDYFNLVLKMNAAFEAEKPEVIYDPEGYMEQVFYRIPAIDSMYTQRKPNYYFLNK